ncbi:fumarate reductase iron-sulfur subunit [Motiliproteus sp. SC1-56]|uniref:fumarate reductase iron-sulfur subunit n=1 Tax=Motiliproteus sp. SC1-56 TaxID=2799565 RepID=UPI001A8C8B41|nr:fumarate reductase iron-sulfur subunit [Motiliproteus sp. SC1-56]
MNASGRTLTLNIFRFDPRLEGDQPRMQRYQLPESDGMTLFIALNKLREEQDPSLKFDFVCRAGICGSCAMVINGKPGLTCRTLTTASPAGEFTLHPLPAFELIGDLSVDTGRFMRAMSERIEGWVHREKAGNIHVLEERMEPALAEAIYELDRCIECGCCVAACATKRMKESFLGAVGFMKLARFRLDPRDGRDDADYYEVIGSEDGVFGCMSLLGCEDSCPKALPHQVQIAYLRRKMLQA